MMPVATLLLLLSGAAAEKPPRIDHVIVAVSDLDRGIEALERATGVRAVAGGPHPGRGTRNALMSLGEGTYLELLAPDPAEPVESADVGELRRTVGLKPVGWAVAAGEPSSLRSLYAGLGLALGAAEPGSRLRPDHVRLAWTTFGFEGFDHPLAPFFIRWEQPDLHPSRTSPGGCRLRSIRISDPAAAALARAIGPLRLPVTVTPAPKSRMQLRLSCDGRRVRIG